MAKKLRIGWFSFTCCEDSTIIFTEMLNENWQDWFSKLDFIHAKILKSKNKFDSMDVAFVEGAICTAEHEETVKKIRSLSKYLVTIGSCACTGYPSSQRNTFNYKQKADIKDLLTRFGQYEYVKKISDVVSVDDMVNGCPMTEQQFLLVLNKYLKEFEIK
jgi:sulfhydrogenase subunit delta